MVGVNLDQTADKGLECQQENKLNWPSFYDGTSMKIHDGYGIFAIPTILVIDHEGKIQWIGHQFNDRLVDKLIAQAE